MSVTESLQVPAAAAGVAERLARLTPRQRAVLERRLAERRSGTPEPGAIARRPDPAAPAPLTFQQRRLWFLHQMDPDSPAYNLAFAIELHGELSVPALEQAMGEIVRRHASLRTRFVQPAAAGGGAEPVQEVGPVAPLHLPVAHVSGAADPGALARRLGRELAWRPFDLERRPLLRAAVLRLAPDRHLAAIALSHVVGDDWSAALLVRELSALYRSAAAGQPSPLPEPEIQYADFAAWQRQRLQGDALQALLDHWAGRLGREVKVHDLPTDRPRSAVRRNSADSWSFALAPAVAAAVGGAATRHGVSPFMLLAAGFQALLHGYTGQRDLRIGFPIANRERRELEPLIGFFANTLVLRTLIDPGAPVAALLAAVKEAALDAFAHQELPFERLVEELRPERTGEEVPLFRVMFMVQNAPRRGWRLPGLEVRGVDLGSGTAKFDLIVWFQESAGGGMTCGFEYRDELFDRTTVRRLGGHLERLLAQMAAHPERPVVRLAPLSSAERQQIVHEWNDTAAPFDREATLPGLFLARAAAAPEAIAVETATESWSYGALAERTARLAGHLRAAGAGPGSLVAVYLGRGVEMVAALVAVLRTGAAYVPLDAAYPRGRVDWILESMGIRHVLCDGERLARLAGGEPAPGVEWAGCLDAPDPQAERAAAAAGWSLAGPQRLAADPPPPAGAPEPAAEHLAYVIFTSGSTGRPKGVVLRHRPVVNLVQWVNRTFAVGPGDRLLFVTSPCFDLSVYDVFGILAAGATVRVAGEAELEDPERLIALLAGGGITFWDSAPAALRRLVPFFPAAPARESRLRLVFLSGDWIPLTLPGPVRRSFPGARVISLGGATEAAIWSNVFPVGEIDPHWASIPYGRPIDNARYHVLDGEMAPCPVGVEGDLYIGGGVLYTAYAGDPRLTAVKLVPEPFAAAGGRLYRTGDRARYRADGNLEFLGRVDHQVKIRGFRIELGEIEATLASHPGVREAVVLAREDVPGERRLVGYVVPAEPAAAPDAAGLRAHLAEQLPDYMLPTAFVVLAELPVTANGKLDREALPAPEAGREEAGAAVAPRTPMERRIATLWCETLGLETVGVHDNFFELGGDSILGIQIVARARREGLPLHPRHLFQHQTVAELAAVAATVEEGGAGEAREAAETDSGAPSPLTPVQRWFLDAEPPAPHHFNQSVLLAARRPIAPAVLAAATAAVVARHPALASRFRRGAEGWTQQAAAAPGAPPVVAVDLAALPAARRAAALEAFAARLQASLDLGAGPLLRVALFDLGAGERQRLLIVVHHLVVDGVSWRILLEDLFAAVQALDAGAAPAPAPAGSSFAAWARHLERRAAAAEAEAPYWLAQGEAAAVALPRDGAGGPGAANRAGDAEEVTVVLDEDTTRALLHEVPRAYRTGMDDALLAALALAVAERAGGPLRVDLERHGRDDAEDLDLGRTVGWFTAIHPVLLDVRGAGPGEALKRVKERLRAVPGRGLGYGLLRYLGPEPVRSRLAALPGSEILFNYLGQLDRAVSADAPFAAAPEASGAVRDPRQPRAHLLEVSAAVAGGRLRVTWSHAPAVQSRDLVRALAEGHLAALRRLVEHCRRPEAVGYTPSDFPLAALDAATLDRLTAGDPDVEDLYPLSPLQEGFLFHSLETAGADIYLQQLGCTLAGELDVEAFRGAWQDVLDRHTALRTEFLWDGLRRPLQKVVRRLAVEIERHDWSDLEAGEQERRLASLRDAGRRRPVPLDRAPLMRLELVHLGPGRDHLLWTHHHLLLDGWSVARVAEEVFLLYEARRSGRAVELPPARPFRDYVAWLEEQDLAAAEAFWRRRLAGFAEPVVLSTRNAPGGSARDEWFAEASLRLSAEASEGLRAWAQRHRLTVATLVQGVWGLLLSRYSGRRDVVFGAVTSGRPPSLPGIEAMVGMFINTLPVRVAVDPSAAVDAWLAALQAAEAEARQYEYTPLVAVQGWSEVPRGEALFESLVIFENYPVAQAVGDRERRGLAVEGVSFVARNSYPLTLLAEPGAALPLALLYDTRHFDAATVERMLGHVRTLLEGCAAGAARLGALPMLTAAERRQVLDEWNPERSEEFLRGETVVQRLRRVVAARPDAVALVDGELQVTYGELGRRAGRLAARLRRHGVGPETPVAVCLERGAGMVLALLAAVEAGGAYVPLDPVHPPERLRFVLADTAAPVLVGEPAVLAAAGLDGVGEDGGLRVLAPWAEEDEAPPRSPAEPGSEHLAYVIYTSGSTGRPKGVEVRHAELDRLFGATDAWFGFGPGDVWSLFHSYAFDFSVWEMWGALAHGGRLVVVPRWVAPSAEAFHRVLAEERVTVLNQTPSAFRQLDAADRDAGGGTGTGPAGLALRHVVFGGEALELHTLAGWFERHGDRVPRLVNMYGITETTVHVTYRPLAVDDLTGGSVVGRPIPDLACYLLGRDLEPLPVGVTGEIFVGGAGVARGYLGRPALTAQRFVPDPYGRRPGARLYRSGDLGRFLLDGDVEYLGRADQQVKIRGFRIELGEIEAALAAHPAVREAAVLVREDVPGDRRLVAYLVPDGDAPPAAELRERLAERLPEYMVPAAYVALERFPLTANGKLDRARLPAPAVGLGEDDGDAAAPRTPTEELLAGAFGEVLGVERVGRGDDFFQLGGHSLLATQLVSRVRRTFGVELPLRSVFEAPTVAELAAEVAAAARGEAAPPVEPAAGPRPLSWAQQRLWFLDHLHPGSSAFNVPLGLRVEGELGASLLAQTLAEVVRRHEVLRTRFPTGEDGEPRPVVEPPAPVPLARVDLGALAPGDAEAVVRRLAREEARRPFDLAGDRPLRAALLRLAPQRRAVLLTVHHIACDGWSLQVLTREVSALAADLAAGRPPSLPELPVQYGDYAAWQRRWLGEERLAAQLAYWREQLAGLPVVELPPDRPRPERPSFRGAAATVEVPAERAAALRGVGRRCGATLFMTLLAAFQVVLRHATGRDDLAVGTDVANRDRLETEGLVGFFVNQVVLRTDLAGDPTFAELVERVRTTALAAYAHQDLPFERLVDALGGERSLRYAPLFQIKVFFEAAPRGGLGGGGRTVAPLEVEPATAQLDLTLALRETPAGGVRASAGYSTDLYDETTIRRTLRLFDHVLDQAGRRPEIRLAELAELLQREEARLHGEESRRRRERTARAFRDARPRPVSVPR